MRISRRRSAKAAIERAPRSRETLAGLIDAGAGIGVMVLLARVARGREEPWPTIAQTPPGRVAGVAIAVLSQQGLGPGSLIAGVRTVELATGRRPPLRNTLVLLGVNAATQQLAKRIAGVPPQVSEEERERDRRELQDIWEGHREDPDGRREALIAHYRSMPVERRMHVGRVLAPSAAQALVMRLLKRRLAPTAVVLARGPRPHRP